MDVATCSSWCGPAARELKQNLHDAFTSAGAVNAAGHSMATSGTRRETPGLCSASKAALTSQPARAASAQLHTVPGCKKRNRGRCACRKASASSGSFQHHLSVASSCSSYDLRAAVTMAGGRPRHALPGPEWGVVQGGTSCGPGRDQLSAASNCSSWGSRVARSTSTAVPLLRNSGRAMTRTLCPPGPAGRLA